MAADAGDDVGEPGLGLKAVEPGGSHERVERGRTLASGVRAAGKALRTGKATPAQIRSMAGRIESERAAVKKAKKR